MAFGSPKPSRHRPSAGWFKAARRAVNCMRSHAGWRKVLTLTAGTAVGVTLVAISAGWAKAEVRFTVHGAGFGHGVGMSQYGAQGMARRGASYRRILRHYYPVTQLVRGAAGSIRVLLADGLPQVEFVGGARIPGRRRLDRDRTYRAALTSEGKIQVETAKGKRLLRSRGSLRVDGQGRPVRLVGAALNGVSDGYYRGSLELRAGAGGLRVINGVELEDYLRGVVASEMSSSWRREALKAQAVAARSYALSTARQGGEFDHYPDTRSQVYKGVAAERQESDAAIAATAGEVLRFRGAVAATFFHSSSGGRTESVENSLVGGAALKALGRGFPYLRSVEDPHDRWSPHRRWALSLSEAEVKRRLGSLVEGRFRGIDVRRRGDSPRILFARVVGTRGSRPTTGAALRARLGLRDSWATFGRIQTVLGPPSSAPRSPPRTSRPTVGVLVGSVTPLPPGGRIAVEVKTRRGWRLSEMAYADESGRFRVAVTREARFRVRAQGAYGPAVIVRPTSSRG